MAMESNFIVFDGLGSRWRDGVHAIFRENVP